MLYKTLNLEEKLLFGKDLHESATLNVKAQVTEAYALATGYSAQTYKDKMCGHRNFTMMELDIVIGAFRRAYGEELFTIRFRENFDAYPVPAFNPNLSEVEHFEMVAMQAFGNQAVES